jgi:hypothetical protein
MGAAWSRHAMCESAFSIIAPGIITDCILRVDFLDEFEVIISFKGQC